MRRNIKATHVFRNLLNSPEYCLMIIAVDLFVLSARASSVSAVVIELRAYFKASSSLARKVSNRGGLTM